MFRHCESDASAGTTQSDQVTNFHPFREILAREWPFLTAACLLLVCLSYTLPFIMSECAARFFYPCDDFYINMGLARRLIAGTARGEFPSASTCAGWILFMSLAVAALGVKCALALPGTLNTLASLLALRAFNNHMKPQLPNSHVFVFLLLFIWAVGLVPLSLIGMEHISHMLFCVLWGVSLFRTLNHNRADRLLPLWSLLGAMCRNEMVFVACAGAVILFFNRQLKVGLLMLAASLLPMAAQALVQASQGHNLLSNPIHMKSIIASHTSLALTISYALAEMHRDTFCILYGMILLSVTLLCLAGTENTVARSVCYCTMALGLSVLFHTILARTGALSGALGRYQAYLIALGLLGMATAWGDIHDRFHARWGMTGVSARCFLYTGAAFALVLVILGTRDRAMAWCALPKAAREIYTQMYQIARLASSAGINEPVVLNDVGCTLFYTDAAVLDLYGLTSWSTAKLGGISRITRDQLQQLADHSGAKMAVIYPDWFVGRIPRPWIPVGEWETPPTFYAAQRLIRVYATSQHNLEPVRQRWNRFAANLPDGLPNKTLAPKTAEPNKACMLP